MAVVALGNMKGRRQWRLMVLPLFICFLAL